MGPKVSFMNSGNSKNHTAFNSQQKEIQGPYTHLLFAHHTLIQGPDS